MKYKNSQLRRGPQQKQVPSKQPRRPTVGSNTALNDCNGVLELHPKGFGFVRGIENNLARRDDDVFVPWAIIQKYRLRQGVSLCGTSQRLKKSSGPRLTRIGSVNGVDPAAYVNVPSFDSLTPTNPNVWLQLEHADQPVAMRILDLLCPIGLGQRALIASPPKAGKTTLLKQIGRSILTNYPDIHLAVLLIDERPEEVTDMRSEISGEVFASSLDHGIGNHARLSHLVIDRCRRLVETGKDVFLLVDSLTRLARACNKLPGMTGPIGAGGLNIRALEIPRQLFSAARAFADGGSLTIVASVLIETDNRMDETIFREFKGTGNLDLHLSQQLADRRIWPAIDVAQSATRRVELLHDANTLRATTALRNMLLHLPPIEGVRELVQKLDRIKCNEEFVDLINSQVSK